MDVRLDELFGNDTIAPTARLLGKLTKGELRGLARRGYVHRLCHGYYARTPPTLELRLDALDRAYGRRVSACLGTAARLHGFDTETTELVHIHDPGAKHVKGFERVVIHQRLDAPLTDLRGRLVTTAAWTAVELARTLRRPRALATLDAALATNACTPGELRDAAIRQAGRRNIVETRRLVDIADPGAASPKESEARLIMLDAGLPAPVLQHPVLDHTGHPRYYLDFAWPDAMLAVEYDSDAHHSGAQQMRRDKARTAWLIDQGWTVVPITADDLRTPTHLTARLRRLLSR